MKASYSSTKVGRIESTEKPKSAPPQLRHFPINPSALDNDAQLELRAPMGDRHPKSRQPQNRKERRLGTLQCGALLALKPSRECENAS
jgi:hypothetical protein